MLKAFCCRCSRWRKAPFAPMGAEAVRQMVDMALRYGAILEKAMREASYGKA